MARVAAVIIGDEVLSGKVRDLNSPLLIDALRAHGAALGRLALVGDDPEAIADEVRRCVGAFDAVVTSGGVGPTHDDRTVEGVARALALPVVRHPELEATVRRLWGARVNEAALRMADVPLGARLLGGGDDLLPAVVARTVYLLPGVPRLFAAKLPAVCAELGGPRPILAGVHLDCDETTVAALLARVAAESPAVTIGSYPRLEAGGEQLWVTVEGLEKGPVRRALERLLEQLPAGHVVRVEETR